MVVYSKLSSYLSREKIGFATCKEGFFSLHTVPDCCGFYLLREYVKRPTLFEFYIYAKSKGSFSLDSVDDVYSEICDSENIVCSKDLEAYPRVLRKPLKYHEKRLIGILKDKNALNKLGTDLKIWGIEFMQNHSLPQMGQSFLLLTLISLNDILSPSYTISLPFAGLP